MRRRALEPGPTMTAPRPSTSPLRPLVLAGLLCSAALGPAEAATFRNVANVAPGHVAWIYRHPDPASQRVGYLKAGALRVRTTSCMKLAKGGWCQVMRRGTRGWVQDRFLKADDVMRG